MADDRVVTRQHRTGVFFYFYLQATYIVLVLKREKMMFLSITHFKVRLLESISI